MPVFDLSSRAHGLDQAFAAGAVRRWLICGADAVYTAGTFGIDDTGMLKISWRTTSDMSKPQFDEPRRRTSPRSKPATAPSSKSGSTASTSGHGRTRILIRVGRGYLREGDTITLRMGDRRQGSPGYRLQTNCEAKVELKTIGRCLCGLRVLRTTRAASFRSGAGTGSELEGDLCRRSRSWASRSGSRSSPRTCGATRPTRRTPAHCA